METERDDAKEMEAKDEDGHDEIQIAPVCGGHCDGVGSSRGLEQGVSVRTRNIRNGGELVSEMQVDQSNAKHVRRGFFQRSHAREM